MFPMHHQVTSTGRDSKEVLDAVLLAFPIHVRPDDRADCVRPGWHAELPDDLPAAAKGAAAVTND
jgi:hypothetical protein